MDGPLYLQVPYLYPVLLPVRLARPRLDLTSSNFLALPVTKVRHGLEQLEASALLLEVVALITDLLMLRNCLHKTRIMYMYMYTGQHPASDQLSMRAWRGGVTS